jgi:glucosylceramidase
MKVPVKLIGIVSLILFVCGDCTKKTTAPTPDPTPDPPPTAVSSKAEMWLTKADQSILLQKQSEVFFSSPANSFSSIEIDSTQTMQSIDGFGYTLTGGSASLINQLAAGTRALLLEELFGNNSTSISVSYLRISIGASDLSASVFSYDDMPAGQTDPALTNFSLSQDTVDVIPVLKQILAINPALKIMGSPWSPPVWMKDNGASKGGSLLPQYYASYAQYFIKYIQQMKAKGITIDAITPQNEPLHPGNNPSMFMTALQQADFIKNHLGPAFQAAGITTKIIIYDHNADEPNYPITVLNDAGAKQFIDGSAFHLYAGDISALSTVRNAHPTKNLYFTEQWTGANGTFDGDLKWHTKNVIIGSMRNWSKVALEWNLANDPAYGPHTPGGCTECKGAITISGNSLTKNVAYYIIAQASKFVPSGSVRISSSSSPIPNVAFLTPTGKKVLIALNEGTTIINFNIKMNGKWALANIPAGAVATYVW